MEADMKELARREEHKLMAMVEGEGYKESKELKNDSQIVRELGRGV